MNRATGALAGQDRACPARGDGRLRGRGALGLRRGADPGAAQPVGPRSVGGPHYVLGDGDLVVRAAAGLRNLKGGVPVGIRALLALVLPLQ